MKWTATGVFLAAFLLFQVQPLLAKYILPWFGGGPSVWTTALMFFQIALLGGYWYAHLIRTHLSVHGQIVAQGILAVVGLALLPIIPREVFRPDGNEEPTIRILLLLAVTVGPQYLLLASTSPLLQAWTHESSITGSPYRLYALSNLASLLALVSYPLVVDPWLDRDLQAWTWSTMFVVLAAVLGRLGWTLWRARPVPLVDRPRMLPKKTPTPVRLVTRLQWLMWSATGSTLLLSVTNEITQDVAVVPFLWVLPLVLYLLTFVITFERERWYKRRIFMVAMIPAISLLLWMMFRAGTVPIVPLLGAFMFGLFVFCMVCHGELARIKPSPSRLTDFYLMIAAGGAVGGVFVAVVAPLIFSMFFELHVGVLVCVGMTVLVLARDQDSPLKGGRPLWAWVGVAVGYVGLSFMLTRHVEFVQRSVLAKERNFFGVLTVLRLRTGTADEHLAMRNGMIDHGVQLVDPDKRSLPTSYYGYESGLGITMRSFPRTQGRRIGVVGLGVGTVASYGRPGDTVRVYEINPTVTRMARQFFSYLVDSPAEIDIVHGDGRRVLEGEPAQRFDILILDAFSGDAIPVHLVTREAFSAFARHLAPGGVLVVNISNRHLDLTPVVHDHGQHLGLEVVRVTSGRGANVVWSADWVLLTKNESILDDVATHPGSRVLRTADATIRPWTDSFANIFAVLRRPW